MKQSGIYRIVNKINGKGYVGSAINFIKRWWKHKFDLRKNRHHSIKLQNAWNKYGEENFDFIVIELVKDKNKLIEREQYWINFYDASHPKKGYNVSPTAGSPLGVEFEHTKQLKKDLLKFVKNNGYLPSAVGKTKKERKMGKALSEYINKNSHQYDKEFLAKIINIPTWLDYRSQCLKAEILNFCKKTGYRPSFSSKNKNEKRLAERIWAHSTKDGGCYDENFSMELNKYPTLEAFYRESLKNKIIKFIRKYKRLPKRYSLNCKERQLARYIKHRLNKCKKSYDPYFKKIIFSFVRKFNIKTKLAR